MFIRMSLIPVSMLTACTTERYNAEPFQVLKYISSFKFVRRHHCRRCGRVVCDTCSPFKRILSNSGRIPVRICKDCDKAMFEQR
jgi:hypothetical protein